MIKRRKTFIYTILAALVIVIAIVSLLIFLPDYKVSQNEAGNRILTVKKGIGHFSLEIPPDYEVDEVIINDEYIGTSVYLTGPIPEDGYRPVFSVYVDESTYDAATKVEERIIDYRTSGRLPSGRRL